MMVTRGSLLAIAILTSSACAVDEAPSVADRAQGIIGGDIAPDSRFPATGMLILRDHMICTATLIAPDVAITAGHCVNHKPAFGSFAFTLDTDASDGFTDPVPVSVTHTHPAFDDGVDDFVDLAVRNDLGIVLLDYPITTVTPERVELPADHYEMKSGDELSMCGYGRTVWHTPELPTKREGEIIVDRIADHEFSTAAADPQPCLGDSGAPMFQTLPDGSRVIVGIVSRAMGRSVMCDTGAIITRVKPYSDWIFLASNDHNAGGCSAGGGGALPFGLIALAGVLVRRRRPR